MKKIFFYAVILTVCFTSCNKEEFIENNELAPEEVPTLAKVYSADADANTLRPFATALYDALKESPRLREIIKTEALKKFNKEYDVLYQFIKNEAVEDGLTVRQLLLKHFENEEMLATIETSHPTLTIFVPQLPENSFSAEIWNTIEQVPAVAIHSSKLLHIPIIADYGFFDENSNEFIMEAGHIPAFPVVVIKDNARVVVAKNGETRSPTLAAKKSDFTFEFTNEFFDGSKTISTQSGATYDDNPRDPGGDPRPSYVDQKLIDSYNLYKGTDGWHRDYIYYGIAPTTTPPTRPGRSITQINDEPDLPLEDDQSRGTLSRDFRETIVSFRFSYSTTPEQMLWHLTNHSGDPTFSSLLGWTGGNYEFEVSIAAATSGTAKLRNVFIASPDELFEVSYTRSGFFGFIGKITGYKTKYFDNNANKDNNALMTWNLDTYEAELKISIAKVNPDQETTISNTTTTEFAANIEGDWKFGEKFVGLTAELSGKTKKEQTHTTKTKLNNKNLGDVLIEFGDMVLLRKPSTDRSGQIDDGLREYGNGMYVIKVAPVRAQNHQR